MARIGSVAQQIRGVTFSKGDSVDHPAEDYVAVLTASNITEKGLSFEKLQYIHESNTRSHHRLQVDDILVTASSGSLSVVGRSAQVAEPVDAVFGAFCKVLRPGPLVDARYLAHFLRTSDYRREVSRLAAGANINNLKNEDLDGLELPLPPLPEQRRIAAILDQADELRTKRRRTLVLLDELADAIFIDMFEHVQQIGLTRTLDSIVDQNDRINYGVVQPGEGVEVGVPLIRVGDMEAGAIRGSSLKKIAVEIEQQYARSRIRGVEILVSCVGTIGRVAVVDESHVGHNVARAVARLPISDAVHRSYVAAALRSPRTQSYFKRELRTVSQPTLNIKQLSETAIRWPSDELMQVFDRRKERIAGLRKIALLAVRNADALFASLQHRAFRGEL